MKYTDSLSTHYASLLEGEYDCINHIVLNGYCAMLLSPGRVRIWYRLMEGSDKDMSNATMMRYAGRFSHRVQSSVVLHKSKIFRLFIFKLGSASTLRQRA